MIRPTGLWDPAPDRIVVFRALNLGDILCSIPAFRSLRSALPHSWITLVGLEGARQVARRFATYVDEFISFPGDPAWPEQVARVTELPAFFRRIQHRRFDVALQMHGSGTQSNGIIQAFGARQWAGFVPNAALQQPGRLMAWPDSLPEINRYLSLLDFLGLPARDTTLEFPLTLADHEEASVVAEQAGIDPRRTIFIHPGARLASRRWPADRFASVARHLAARGHTIAITGSEGERHLVNRVVCQTGLPVANLCGATSLGALASLLKRGRLLICNDTGVSHIAAAVGLRSVVIASGSDTRRWAPLDANLHSVLYEPIACRPCAYSECPIGHPCALAITAEQVLCRAAIHLSSGVKNEQHTI